MDIQRPATVARSRRIRKVGYVLLAAIGILAISAWLSTLTPAAPTVERSSVWTGEVKQGDIIREVRGAGRLVPETIRWIPAGSNGRIERILLQPGATVTADSVILDLSNPELEQTVFEAESEHKRAQAEQENLQVQLESQLINQKAQAADIESEFTQASLRAEADQELSKDGLVSRVTARISQARAESLATRRLLEKERLEIFSKASAAQLQAKEVEVAQRRGLYRLRARQLDSLRVRAGIAGVLQQILVEVGQQVTPGTNLARVAVPDRLKAEIRVAATQARDIQVGQTAQVDTRNGVVPGMVSRIDPAVQEGLVNVDIKLTDELPKGARPDLPVDGTVELEHLMDIVYMPRPAFGQENSTVSVFRIEADGVHAHRVHVRFGRSSVSEIEVLEGLQPGDEVILSDASRWDEYDRIRLD